MFKRAQKAFTIVRSFIESSKDQNEFYANRNAKPRKINISDRVFVKIMTPLNKLEARFRGPMRIVKIKRNSVWVKCLLTEKIYKVHCDRIKVASEVSVDQHKVFPTEEIFLDDAQLISKPKEGYVNDPILKDKEKRTLESPKDLDRPEITMKKATISDAPESSVEPKYALRSRKDRVKNYDNVMSRPIEFLRNHLKS